MIKLEELKAAYNAAEAAWDAAYDAYQAELKKHGLLMAKWSIQTPKDATVSSNVNAAKRILEVPDTAHERLKEMEQQDPNPDTGFIEVGSLGGKPSDKLEELEAALEAADALEAAADAARDAAWDAWDAAYDADYAYRDELKKQEENDK